MQMYSTSRFRKRGNTIREFIATFGRQIFRDVIDRVSWIGFGKFELRLLWLP